MYILVKYANKRYWKYNRGGNLEPEFFFNHQGHGCWLPWGDLTSIRMLEKPISNDVIKKALNDFGTHPLLASRTAIRVYFKRYFHNGADNMLEDVFIMAFDDFISYAKKRIEGGCNDSKRTD